MRKLLEARFGLNWEEIVPLSTWNFYNKVFQENPEARVEKEPEGEIECVCLEEETEFRHI